MLSRVAVAARRILAFATIAVLTFTGGAVLSLKAAHAQAPGADACAGCHEAQVKTFMGSKHGTKADRRTPMSTGGCGSCHVGDMAAHVKASGGKGVGGLVSLSSKAVSAEDKNKACLGCHQGDPTRLHWKDSVHAGRDVACTSCHQVHTSRDKVRDKVTQSDVCFACHKEQRVQINKPARHPILEGKVSCADCHNVHGNNPKQMARGSVVETCYQCHMEKRGPFVHNHQPVTEDCTICHQPHGSTLASMLKARVPFLCQDCHATAGHPTQNAGRPTTPAVSIGTGTAGTVGRGCLACHTNIHGSNSTQDNTASGRFRR